MHSLRVRALCLVALICPGLAAANDLLDSYRSAQAQDATLAAALHARDAAVEARPQALSVFLPQLNGTANVTRDRQEITSSVNPAARTGTFYSTNQQYGASLTQQIWSFESYHLLKEADSSVAAAENTYRSAQQALALRVAQAYFNVLSAVDTLRTNEAQKAANAGLLQQAQKRFEVGLAAITDVQEAQAQFDASTSLVISAQRALSNTKRALGVIAGHYTDAFPILSNEIPLVAPQPANVEGWLSAAEAGNYDLRGAQLNAEIAAREVDAKFAKHLPTLALQGQYGKDVTGGNFGTHSLDGQVGVQLSVPIFSGGLTQSLVRQAAATREQRKSELLGTQRTVDQQTRDAFEGVISGIASVKANLQAVKSNQTALEASKVGLQVGTRTEIDVLTSLQNLATAQRTYYQSRYDYLISVLTLKQSVGRLSENDLAEIDALLVAPKN